MSEEPVRCHSCGTQGPETSTLDTAWTRYGWKVARRVGDAGAHVIEFFCPQCWKARKAASSTP